MPLCDFNLYCHKCGSDDVGIHFLKGSTNIKDAMIVFCKNCNTNNHVGIAWEHSNKPDIATNIDLHLAAILLDRYEPLSPHHVGWIREYLNYPTDEEMKLMIRTGIRTKKG